MKFSVQVKPNSRTEGVERIDDLNFVVRVRVPPTENRANERAIELIAEFLKVPKRSVALIAGSKSKKKVFRVD